MDKFYIYGGPCSIESEDQLDKITNEIKDSVDYIRAGAYKLRTNPDTFQGLGDEGLKILSDFKKKHNVKVASEIISVLDIPKFKDVDVIQVGTRNMYNYDLLKALGNTDKTIILKRGMSATIEEWLGAAKYITSHGNNNVILCERGIRTYDSITRNTLDLSSIPLIKKLSDFPIIVDPSHGTGKWYLIESMSKAALAAGADGIMIEVHNDPDNALSDGFQSLTTSNFVKLVNELKAISIHFGKEVLS